MGCGGQLLLIQSGLLNLCLWGPAQSCCKGLSCILGGSGLPHTLQESQKGPALQHPSWQPAEGRSPRPLPLPPCSPPQLLSKCQRLVPKLCTLLYCSFPLPVSTEPFGKHSKFRMTSEQLRLLKNLSSRMGIQPQPRSPCWDPVGAERGSLGSPPMSYCIR